ncbi:nicastrin-like [Scylla paramamosain]|uniref:nicastrin-like n=1 Tax=Scylla paramamosain TaxID=85552 RepID=UPI0030838E97
MAGRGVTQLKLLASLCLFIATADYTNGERVKQKIYQDIQGDMACFKRFNGTHEFGCTSKFYGNLGVVHVVDSSEDLTWVFDHGPHQPYVLALYPEFMTVEVLQQADHSGKVSGVILMVEEDFDPASLYSGFSGETPCPNEGLGLYTPSLNPEYAGYCQNNSWNRNGTSLLYMNWNFPVFLIDNQSSINHVIDCYKNFNEPDANGSARSWPLCYSELKSNMFGTTNTEVCMRRRSLAPKLQTINFCDPLSDFNIWGTLKPMNSSEVVPEKSVIIVATRMDASSMFDNISPGANSAVSGLVTLMLAAEALYKMKEEIIKSGTQKNVLFVIFQGEAWGYIGSSRMVWDMEKGQFPFEPQKNEPDQMSQVNFTHISSFIELAQVGLGMTGDISNIFLHTDPISNSDPDIKMETKEVISSIHSAANVSDSISVENADNVPLPPASLQSFLKRVNISGVVITDHKKEFKNKFYESIFDNYHNVNFLSNSSSEDQSNQVEDKYHLHISRIASVLATSLYSLLTDSQPSSLITVNQTLANDLLYCYLRNVSCQMFQEYGEALLGTEFFNDKPAKMYVSVKRGESGRTVVTNSIFASLLGERKDYNESVCVTNSFYQVNQFYYFSSVDNGTCFESTVRKTEAMSPAFLIDDYDWQSGEYSTWTESGWQLTELRIFLRPSVVHEIALVSGGVASLLLSLGVVYFMNSRANILFSVVNPPAAC